MTHDLFTFDEKRGWFCASVPLSLIHLLKGLASSPVLVPECPLP